MQVEYRNIDGIDPLYKAGSDGEIYSFYGENARKLRASNKNARSYKSVSVVLSNGVRCSKDVHRLICTAFHGKPLNIERMTVSHIDGNKDNSAPSNLRWRTYRENLSHKYYHDTHDNGIKNSRAVLDKDSLFVCRWLLTNTDITIDKISDIIGVKDNVVKRINNNTRYKNIIVEVVENTLPEKVIEGFENGAV